MVLTRTHGIDMDSWYWQGLMVYAWTHSMDNTHGIDLDSWYSIGAPESHTYERAMCCPYAGFFNVQTDKLTLKFNYMSLALIALTFFHICLGINFKSSPDQSRIFFYKWQNITINSSSCVFINWTVAFGMQDLQCSNGHRLVVHSCIMQ